MIAALICLVLGGNLLLAVVLGARHLEARSWRRSLVAMSVQFPRGLSPDQVGGWLAMLGTLRTVVALEAVATPEAISHFLVLPRSVRGDVLAGTRAVLPALRLEDAPDYLGQRAPVWAAAASLRITHLSHQLAVERAGAAAAAFLAALGTLQRGEAARVQWLVRGMRTPKARTADDPAKELARAEKVKHAQPMLAAVGRVGVAAATPGRAWSVLNRLVGSLRVMDAPNVGITRRQELAAWARRALMSRSWPLAVWPVVVNTREAVGIVGVPIGDLAGLSGLSLASARQLPPPAGMSRRGTVLAQSTYPGRDSQPLVLTPDDRLRHVYCVGPTGVGESELLAQIAIQDAAAGHGLCLIDPKGDLVEVVLTRLPEAATDRVVVVDPSQTDRPVGLNPLAVAGNDEQARELAADQVLHVMRELFAATWGVRTDDVMRQALLTLVNVPAPGGGAFTLLEIPELLTNAAFRQRVINSPRLAQHLRGYWLWFDGMSASEQLQYIGPVLNKLRAFTVRSATRLMLGANSGLDFTRAMAERQIVLVSLAKGRIGPETATLIGSLIVAAFWQAVLGRVAVEPARRQPYYLIADEFQDVVRSSDTLPELLSQARGLGVGAVLANQYVAQLPESVRAAVLGTVRSQVAFQVEHDDARLLERRFAPSMSAEDLTSLSRYEVAIRPCVNGQTAAPATGRTLGLPQAVRDASELARAARARWGQARAEVEAQIASRTQTKSGSASRRVGRLPGGQAQ